MLYDNQLCSVGLNGERSYKARTNLGLRCVSELELNRIKLTKCFIKRCAEAS